MVKIARTERKLVINFFINLDFCGLFCASSMRTMNAELAVFLCYIILFNFTMAALIDSLLEPAAGVVLGAAGYFCFQYWENFDKAGVYETVVLGVCLSLAALLLLNLRGVLDLAISHKLCVPFVIFSILGGILFGRIVWNYCPYSDINAVVNNILLNFRQALDLVLLHKLYVAIVIFIILVEALFLRIVWKFCSNNVPVREASVPVDNAVSTDDEDNNTQAVVMHTESEMIANENISRQPIVMIADDEDNDTQAVRMHTEPEMIIERPEVIASEDISTAMQELETVRNESNDPDEVKF